MELLLIFIALNIVNVIMQTVKSLCTINSGKFVAAMMNAVAYGLYTVVLVYMVCDLSLWVKVLVVGGCNFIGVFVVKLIEEKARKDKLWKVEATVESAHTVSLDMVTRAIPHSVIKVSDKHTLFNFYCATQKESHMVRETLKDYNAKVFVAESKTL